MIRSYFNSVQQLGKQPGSLFVMLLRLRNILIRAFGFKGKAIELDLFSYSNKLGAGARPKLGDKYPEIEILFVTTKKDFEILPYAIRAAQKSVQHHSGTSTSLIVPDSEIKFAQLLTVNLPGEIYVLPESDFFSSDQMARVRQHFGSRAGWVIQQLLKVEFVSSSRKEGVLVVDSDTLLLEPRVWLDSQGRQLLTPTWEWNKPYYDFLEQAGFEKGSLTHSFVPHHMLMQPVYMREARNFVSWGDFEKLISYLVLHGRNEIQSPFCIEFELYAQFMLQNHPNKIEISKWANIGIPRSKTGLANQIEGATQSLSGKFASVSFHEYL